MGSRRGATVAHNAMRYFEDFPLGAQVDSPSRTVTEQDVEQFAELTGDFSPQHLDPEYAASTVFGKPIAHGALLFSLASGLSSRIEPDNPALIALFAVDEVRFLRPVFPSDTVRVSKRVVAAVEKDPRRGLIVFDTGLENQHGQVVLSYRDSILFKRRQET